MGRSSQLPLGRFRDSNVRGRSVRDPSRRPGRSYGPQLAKLQNAPAGAGSCLDRARRTALPRVGLPPAALDPSRVGTRAVSAVRVSQGDSGEEDLHDGSALRHRPVSPDTFEVEELGLLEGLIVDGGLELVQSCCELRQSFPRTRGDKKPIRDQTHQIIASRPEAVGFCLNVGSPCGRQGEETGGAGSAQALEDESFDEAVRGGSGDAHVAGNAGCPGGVDRGVLLSAAPENVAVLSAIRMPPSRVSFSLGRRTSPRGRRRSAAWAARQRCSETTPSKT